MNKNYFILDWDDNILHMDTKIFVEYFNNNVWEEIAVSSSEYREVRKNPLYKEIKNGYRNCHGNGTEFLNDVKYSVEMKKFGPSFYSLINSLINGNIISIVTARGHDSITIKSGVEWLIYNYISEHDRKTMLENINKINLNSIDSYLELCKFIGVYSTDFIKTIPEGIENSTENYKKIAVEKCVLHYIDHSKTLHLEHINIGFSDDDKHNVIKIKEYFEEIKSIYNFINFSVFDTSTGSIEKIVI